MAGPVDRVRVHRFGQHGAFGGHHKRAKRVVAGSPGIRRQRDRAPQPGKIVCPRGRERAGGGWFNAATELRWSVFHGQADGDVQVRASAGALPCHQYKNGSGKAARMAA